MVDSDCRRSHARHGATTGLALLLAVASGCGGQSVSGPEDGGEGGDSGAGAAGKSSNSGSAGVGTGGSGTNGGFAGTPASGGTVTGGAGNGAGGGSSGSAPAGAGGMISGDVCSLPLESGECNAYIPSWGFDPALGLCREFVYGGCGGNANRFESFEACGTRCGFPDETGCPPKMPGEGVACMDLGHDCHYQGYDFCSCRPVGAHTCESVDPACPGSLARRPPADGGGGACDGSDCTAEVVIVEYFGCSCRDSGWTCVPASLGGGR